MDRSRYASNGGREADEGGWFGRAKGVDLMFIIFGPRRRSVYVARIHYLYDVLFTISFARENPSGLADVSLYAVETCGEIDGRKNVRWWSRYTTSRDRRPTEKPDRSTFFFCPNPLRILAEMTRV